jgi:tetratricopeptide (TPR) repeat protein
MKLLGAVILAVLPLLGGCGRDAQGASGRRAERAVAGRPHADRHTTSGETALRNLESQISGQERLLARTPSDLRTAEALSSLLLTRAEVLGRVEDLERVVELADDAVAEHPDQAVAHLLAAKSAARLHRFDRASTVLDEAARLGAAAQTVADIRAGLQTATGELERALPVLEQAARARPSVANTGALAAAVAEGGDLRRARRLFTEALGSYRDVSPFVVAWLEMQEGLALERAGDLAEAARYYRRVRERLPRHVQAASHLAAIEAREGRRDAAIALLEPAVRGSDDPETAGQLSVLLRTVGRTAEADRLRDAAAARYGVLLARHPAAFADHAARFRLEVEGDAPGALVLAEQNLAVRHTAAAVELAVTAAMAARRDDRACAITRGRTLPDELQVRLDEVCLVKP